MPIIAPNKIQKAAPGPPIEIDIATPAIVPNPTVPDKAVIKAPRGEISPPASSFLGFFRHSIECFTPQKQIPLRYRVKNTPATKSHNIITGTCAPNKFIGKNITDATLSDTGVTYFSITEFISLAFAWLAFKSNKLIVIILEKNRMC